MNDGYIQLRYLALSRDLCKILQDGLESLSLSWFQIFKAYESIQQSSMKSRQSISSNTYSITIQNILKYPNTKFVSLRPLEKTSPKTTIYG